MKVFMYDTHGFEKGAFCENNKTHGHDLNFFEGRLHEKSAALAEGYDVICAFVNDRLNAEVLETLAKGGTKLIALRSAGFNHVDLGVAKRLGLKVVRVPEYSPYSVAEHAMALILTLNRKLHKSYNRVREGNFSLEGLVGFDLHGKTIGVVGTGKIGMVFATIARGFGCRVLAYDLFPNKQLDVTYVDLQTLYQQSDIISLHVPLSAETRHLINESVLTQMKPGAMLINTSRGGLVDTRALIEALKGKTLGAAGLDVYEEEAEFFFQDHSQESLSDDLLIRLMTFPNVLLTSHQGFLTAEALSNIAQTTLENIGSFERGEKLVNEVVAT
jgi:D-lactate dehydrogenase